MRLVINSLSALGLAFLTGCAEPVVQDNPSAHQKIVFASAYSVESCEAKMADLARGEVKMVNDSAHLAASIFSLGIVPSHQCIGVVKDPLANTSAPIKHE